VGEGPTAGWVTPSAPAAPVPRSSVDLVGAPASASARTRDPRPGVVPLRPLGLSDVLDGALATVRRNPAATVVPAAAGAGVVSLVSLVVALALRGPSTQVTTATAGFLQTLVSGGLRATLTLLVTAPVAVVVGRAVLGERTSLAAAATAVRSRLGPLCVVVVLQLVVSIAGLLTLGAVTVWLWVAWGFAVPVAMLEPGARGRSSLARSRVLVRGRWWATFGVLGLALLITTVVGAVISVPVTLVVSGGSALSGASVDTSSAALAVTALASTLILALTLPFTAAVTALLYVDRRMRVEGLDVALALAAAEAPRVPR